MPDKAIDKDKQELLNGMRATEEADPVVDGREVEDRNDYAIENSVVVEVELFAEDQGADRDKVRCRQGGHRCLYSSLHNARVPDTSQFLGWHLVHMAQQRAEKRGTPKAPNSGRVGGCQAPQKNSPRLRPLSPLSCLHLGVGLPH